MADAIADQIVRDFAGKVAAMPRTRIVRDLAEHERLKASARWWTLDPEQRDRLAAMGNVLREALNG